MESPTNAREENLPGTASKYLLESCVETRIIRIRSAGERYSGEISRAFAASGGGGPRIYGPQKRGEAFITILRCADNILLGTITRDSADRTIARAAVKLIKRR